MPRPTSRDECAAAYIEVQGRCPMGCGRTLFLGEGGHVTCSWAMCPNPAAADDLLHTPALPTYLGARRLSVEITKRGLRRVG